MTVKGTFHIDHLGNPTGSSLDVSVSINGHESGNIVESGETFTLDIGLTASMKDQLATAVANWLVSNHSYTFTPIVDSVQEI